ncbi:hypothetical protein ACOME3_008533 [Neoechinorhynchus agilis]
MMTKEVDIGVFERLRAVLHRQLGNILTEAVNAKLPMLRGQVDEANVEVNCQPTAKYVSTLAEIVIEVMDVHIKDLALFAKHAKRSTIRETDVNLLFRRNESLLDRLRTECNNN